MSASRDKWSLSECTDQIEDRLAETGRAAVGEAERIGDAARDRNERAESLRLELEKVAAELSARTASDGALARLFLTTGRHWREEERVSGERLSTGRGDVRSSTANLGSEVNRLRARAEGCQQRVDELGQILAELQSFEEGVHASLQDCGAMLDDILATQGALKTILTEVAQ
jgi:hypothetical protein